MIQVLIIDDHVAVGMGTKALIEQKDIKADILSESEKIKACIKEKNMMYISLIYICQT